MKKKSAKQVPLPDINALADKQFAQQQLQSDKALTANRANQVNQFGSIDWSHDPATGAWTQTEAYNPEQQALLDQQIKTQGVLGGKAQQTAEGLDAGYANAPAMPTVGGYNEQAMNTIRALQAPDLQRRRAAKEAQLAAMGMGTGSGTAWNTEQQNIGDAESRADMQAIMGGINQGNTEFNQGVTARNTYTGEQDRTLKNVGGMMGAAAPEALKFGDYVKQGVVNAPDYTGNATAMWKMQQDAANAKAAASKGGMMSGLGTVGGGLAAGYFSGWNPAAMQAGASMGGAAGGLFDK